MLVEINTLSSTSDKLKPLHLKAGLVALQ